MSTPNPNSGKNPVSDQYPDENSTDNSSPTASASNLMSLFSSNPASHGFQLANEGRWQAGTRSIPLITAGDEIDQELDDLMNLTVAATLEALHSIPTGPRRRPSIRQAMRDYHTPRPKTQGKRDKLTPIAAASSKLRRPTRAEKIKRSNIREASKAIEASIKASKAWNQANESDEPPNNTPSP